MKILLSIILLSINFCLAGFFEKSSDSIKHKQWITETEYRSLTVEERIEAGDSTYVIYDKRDCYNCCINCKTEFQHKKVIRKRKHRRNELTK